MEKDNSQSPIAAAHDSSATHKQLKSSRNETLNNKPDNTTMNTEFD